MAEAVPFVGQSLPQPLKVREGFGVAPFVPAIETLLVRFPGFGYRLVMACSYPAPS